MNLLDVRHTTTLVNSLSSARILIAASFEVFSYIISKISDIYYGIWYGICGFAFCSRFLVFFSDFDSVPPLLLPAAACSLALLFAFCATLIPLPQLTADSTQEKREV